MVICEKCNVEMECIDVRVGIELKRGFITIFYGEKVYRCPKCSTNRYVIDYKAVDWR